VGSESPFPPQRSPSTRTKLPATHGLAAFFLEMDVLFPFCIHLDGTGMLWAFLSSRENYKILFSSPTSGKRPFVTVPLVAPRTDALFRREKASAPRLPAFSTLLIRLRFLLPPSAPPDGFFLFFSCPDGLAWAFPTAGPLLLFPRRR